MLTRNQTAASAAASLGESSLVVPIARFSGDYQYPIYHPIPPANWTNEPHGLVKHNGQYHMYYQRTPNGPFKTQMHWGHLVSNDLVNWRNVKDALWPELNWSATSGYDMKGIWSGDVVMDGNTAHAFYTNVNHSSAYNPGIAVATSTDSNLEFWKKSGPVIAKENANDLRDPFVWKDGSTWRMLVGAALSTGGGLLYYTSTDLQNWTYQPTFSTVPYSSMDIGSAIWEMPAFESLGGGKYVLTASPIGGNVSRGGPLFTRAVYWVGTFVNGQFTPDYAQPKLLDLIHGHLSPTTERDYNGNLVGIGIVDERRSSQAQLAAGFAHLFSLPRTWHLLPDGKTMGQKPLADQANLRTAGTYQKLTDVSVTATTAVSAGTGKNAEIVAYVDTTATGTKYGLNLRVSPTRNEYVALYYDTQLKKVFLDKTNSSLATNVEEKGLYSGAYDAKAFGKPYKFQVFTDGSIIDVFINDAAAFSNRIYPTQNLSEGVELFSAGGTTKFSSVEGWKMSRSTPDLSAGANRKTYLRYDFEAGNFSDLILSGLAFSPGDIVTTNSGWWGPFKQQGQRHMWSFAAGGDPETGTLQTPNFVLGGDGKVNLLLGGGNDAANLYVALVNASTGAVIAQATGANNEAYTRITLDGSGAIGTTCYFKAVDNSTAGFGHLNLDDIQIPVSKPVTGVSVDRSTVRLAVNEQTLLYATVAPADATNNKVNWTSTNTTVAAVDAAGLVTAKTVGTATIRATTQSGGLIANSALTVTAAAPTTYKQYNFEAGNFSDLILSGLAFSPGDIVTTSSGWWGPFNQEGLRHVWGYAAGGDAETGSMQTPNFILGGDGRISYLQGGANDLANIYVALVRASDNVVLMKTTGLNDETYAPKVLDARAYVNTTCYLKVVDNATGNFGHINVDNILIPTKGAAARTALASETGKVANEGVALYPVPAHESFTLDLSAFGTSEVVIEITDLLGKIVDVRSVQATSHYRMLTGAALKPGQPYVVRVYNAQKSFSKKIVVE